MKNILAFLAFILCSFLTSAQVKILPGDKSLNPGLIKEGSDIMAYYIIKDGNPLELCSYETAITTHNEHLYYNTLLKFIRSNKQWRDTISIDRQSLKTISRKSDRDTRTFNLQYSNTIKGNYSDTKTGYKFIVNSSVGDGYFDIATYPLVICALPLTAGYKSTIPVIDFDAPVKDKVYNVNITDVKSDNYQSELSGQHQIWRVGVAEESTGNTYVYYIDKTKRKIYKIEVTSGTTKVLLVNKETEHVPFKNKFDKEATLKMVTKGSSVIVGKAFAKDDKSGKDDRKLRIDVLNVNKKQYPPKGTQVILIPYTEYYREWIELNKKKLKIQGAKPVPLPEEARSCVLISNVYDDKGNFEFVNLDKGEYLVHISFQYGDTFSREEVTGYGDVYANGQYIGTKTFTDIFDYIQLGTANFDKVVTIKNNGEKVKVKLKRW